MSDLSGVELSELRSRMETLLLKIDSVVGQLAPLIKSYGDLRQETELIYAELTRRQKG